MSDSETILSRIAEAFEAGAKPFALENTRLAAMARDVVAVDTPDPRHELAPGLWLDYQAGSGVQTWAGPVEPAAEEDREGGLRLHLRDIGTSPWYSLSYDLGIETLRDARYLGQYLRCDSDGPARFRPCLRLQLEGGFQDVFARDLVVLTGGTQEDLIFIRLDPELLARAIGAEVLFFFEGRSFDVTLRTIEAVKV